MVSVKLHRTRAHWKGCISPQSIHFASSCERHGQLVSGVAAICDVISQCCPIC